MVEFDRNAEVISFQSYSKGNFEAALKTALEYDFLKNYNSLFAGAEPGFRPNKSWAESISEKMEFSEQVFTSDEGDLYRVATVISKDFRDEAAVNVL